MPLAQSMLVLGVGLLLAAPPLGAQALSSGQVGVAHLAARAATPIGEPRTVTLQLEGPSIRGHPRWPFVVGGAILGAAASGLVLANQIRHTDDAWVFPQIIVVVVGVGAGVGALVGWAVSAALP